MERGGGETSICCSSYYLCIYWLILVCALIRDQTCNFGTQGQCSNQLNYPARASEADLSGTVLELQLKQ